ncbi:hypothetical protein XU18_1325 [Perkinsela sp. CCAP 1560/4]|nr:hypothetical protein XU18_1325 [Perkinsela sp. CCAP 1560/4]|eukprot:KNH08109.1 hypothetical protein XU18_1325 [Perkinsela sp. CCAP 1560/4]
MTLELVLLNTADPSLGRLDDASLSQQALMEVVIEGIANKEEICGDADEPIDIEEWKGVTVEDGEVVEIDWEQLYLEGSFHSEWLPISVRNFTVFFNQFSANPTKGHLSVVGWTSTLSWGKPRAFRILVVFLSWRRPY